ncbi:hypothetical protein FB45DRAFT_1102365 [Roridomyces roridus]|uniref:Uncharacterized protein n=1 Tax=Roridomyces roridus TaxID=1738132 RepID=A0AAD7CGI3_9AGAR|nr:hypothetical protein FB45DRAFT_1102365 [Roridomyces roridus]
MTGVRDCLNSPCPHILPQARWSASQDLLEILNKPSIRLHAFKALRMKLLHSPFAIPLTITGVITYPQGFGELKDNAEIVYSRQCSLVSAFLTQFLTEFLGLSRSEAARHHAVALCPGYHNGAFATGTRRRRKGQCFWEIREDSTVACEGIEAGGMLYLREAGSVWHPFDGKPESMESGSMTNARQLDSTWKRFGAVLRASILKYTAGSEHRDEGSYTFIPPRGTNSILENAVERMAPSWLFQLPISGRGQNNWRRFALFIPDVTFCAVSAKFLPSSECGEVGESVGIGA